MTAVGTTTDPTEAPKLTCGGPIYFADQGIEVCSACGGCICCDFAAVDHSAAEYECFTDDAGICHLRAHEDRACTKTTSLAETPITEDDLARIRDLDLTSCDFCDGGCCDPDCWRCYSPLRPENLRTLAKNLATAGMLCHAWQLRGDDPTWRPGCHIEGVPS